VRVAVLGLGAMGARMSARLVAAGVETHVYNRSPQAARALASAGAHAADSPRAAAERADVVIAVVSDDEASRAVWLSEKGGALHGLRRGAVAVESSTLSPAWVRQLAAAVERREAPFLDAPVVGSRPQAEAGDLRFLVGGSTSALRSVRPVLERLGSAVHHVGPVGSGATMKLVVNALLGVEAAALAEALSLAERAGVDAAVAADVLGATPVASPAMKRFAGLIRSGDFAPNFPLRLAEKDLRYAERLALESGVRLETVRVAHALASRAVASGLGDLDLAALGRVLEDGASEAAAVRAGG
jgi:3-hydroxyisobutyrate dehydrogenase